MSHEREPGQDPNTASPDDGKPVLSISGLEVTFATDGGDVHAVNDVNLDVRPGEVVAIVGESGSGKTVTAKTILGLLPETATSAGVVLVNGSDVLSVSASQLRDLRGRDVAMVFQEPSTALNPVHTVGWQIIEGIRAHAGSGHRISRKEAKARAIEALAKVGIPDPGHRVDFYPHQFSGGQKQRVVIAAALALNPGLIVADEPTTALDVTVQAEILELLRELQRKDGTSIVLITHNMGVVADLADRVVVMYRGDVVEEAPVADLFAHPQQDYTKELLAAVPHLGRNSASAGLEERAHSEAEVLVRATDLEVEFPGGIGKSAFRAVGGVSFQISAGEVYGLVGESGSGKTTIGRSIAGLNKITGGSLNVLGYEMLDFRERTFKPLRKDIGFVFQDPGASFNPHLTIGECVAEPLWVHQDPTASGARDRVRDLMDAVQLPGRFVDRYPHELSGGQRQRASLARGLALNPKLLIADEPTSALDVSVQAAVLDLFKEIQTEYGFAALFISHDLAVVDMLADWVGVLYRGKLVEEGIGSQIMGSPRHDYTRRLIASLPVPDPAEQARRRAANRELLTD
ncbi:MAG: dipeptide ABC transporter ATP-binding protein [Arthrobacter sp.]|uniref:dipeptide ABC transporter ATP-binding protein n=1 Tax=unclassified Arthrobacter TaxID=235627 RepID=UPI00264FDB12|nr:ABC transporter ATP-binding protein [Micrococcaceae bacterium]MDN5886571.1 ABC transporter ATP-binding protein [Micrococcaceae bacterium]MDN5905805.1 ABC transporter ATP-binding protein [Micrococcaceae bacterium]